MDDDIIILLCNEIRFSVADTFPFENGFNWKSHTFVESHSFSEG